MTEGAALSLTGVRKSYRQGVDRLDVLTGVDLKVAPGEVVALTAPSGSGKTTLLQIAGLLDRPDAGSVTLGGVDVSQMDDASRSRLRAKSLGFIFQFHHLLPEFTALENVVMPQIIGGVSRGVARARAAELLEALGLKERLRHRPAELSGGEQQRTAIARALANRPRLVLADEPTGNLDQDTARGVADTLLGLAHDTGVGMLIATHNQDLAKLMDRRLTLSGGVLIGA